MLRRRGILRRRRQRGRGPGQGLQILLKVGDLVLCSGQLRAEALGGLMVKVCFSPIILEVILQGGLVTKGIIVEVAPLLCRAALVGIGEGLLLGLLL